MFLSSDIIMIRWRWRKIMRRSSFLLILISMLLLKPGAAAPPSSRDDTPGAYRLIFRGCYSGTGTAVVTPKFVTIRSKDLYDDAGNAVDFVAQKLPVENHRFHDQVTAGGKTIIITGRVDPSGGSLKKARLNCTFTAVGTGYGRVAGDHN
jgi:hypothetical protein